MQCFQVRRVMAFAVSCLVHACVLLMLGLIQQRLLEEPPRLVLDTFFQDERLIEEFEKAVEVDPTVARTDNVIATTSSPAAASAAGGVGTERIDRKIEDSDAMQVDDRVAAISPGGVDRYGSPELDLDGRHGAINGLSNEPVADYAAALGRMTQELVRLMRERRILVVWLFDESGSMKDDQQEIRQKFHKIYAELGIRQEQDDLLKQDRDVLLTAIHGFGAGVHVLTPRPTSDVNEVRAAIDRIAVDESGDENMCLAVADAIDRYAPSAKRQDRRLVVVIVSDESPSDAAALEESIDKAKRADAPVYVMGREAVFGYPYARVRWIDPVYGLAHWVHINRGPETPFPELLQYDGLTRRYDSDSSGFGPYSQVRICKETGGIFFTLPGEEQDLVGRAAADQRTFESYALKEYGPELLSARDYVAARDRSRFRSAIWNVIETLNPYRDRQLELAVWHFPTDPQKFHEMGALQFEKALRVMELLNQATRILDEVRPLREQEPSLRWRANYDLVSAQCRAYRVRIFQYLVALDQHAKQRPGVGDPKNNEWRVERVASMLEPDAQQVRQTKVDTAILKRQEAEARAMYERVVREHPETPWAQRARKDMAQGFGMKFVDYFHDPRYGRGGVSVPPM